MLVVNDEFKSWMRKKLSDRDYAERIMKVLVDNRDCTRNVDGLLSLRNRGKAVQRFSTTS